MHKNIMYQWIHKFIMNKETNNHNSVGCPAEWHKRTHHFAGNSSFCQVHAFQVWTPIASLSFVCFICQKFIPSKILSSNIISCHFTYNANGMFQLWEFYHLHPSAGNKQSVHIVSFPAGRTRSRPSAEYTTT